MTSEDKGMKPEERKWVCKAPKKKVRFNLEHAKETFMEANKSLTEASTSGNQGQLSEEMDPYMLTTFLEICMKLLCDNKAVKGLQEVINKCVGKENALEGHCVVRKIGKHKVRTGSEMRLTAQIGEYEMDKVILDLGLDANVLPKHTWERMGRPALQWSLIQLRMENQHNIFPMGRLQGVIVDIEGTSALDDFKVIEIFDDNNCYPALLGIDWAIDMNGVINLEKRTMSFERKSLRVVVPLDPAEGPRYTEPVHDYKSDDDLDQLYKIIARDQDCVNPTVDGCVAWDCESPFTSDSDEELEHWQNRLHEVSMLRYNMMTKQLLYVSSKVRSFPYYDSLTDVDKILDAFESEVPKKHCFQALDLALRYTLAGWWATHKDSFDGWHEYTRMMRLWFCWPKVWLTEI